MALGTLLHRLRHTRLGAFGCVLTQSSGSGFNGVNVNQSRIATVVACPPEHRMLGVCR